MTSPTTTMALPLTDELAWFALSAAPDDDALHTARRSLATALPLAIAAADRPALRSLRTTIERLQLPVAATVPGLPQGTGLVQAPLLTATAANHDDFDDTDLETLVHPSPAVVAAALTATEYAKTDLAALLRAIALGLETTIRVGRALGESHVQRGWHISATASSIGAGVAAIAAIGELDRQAARRALSLVSTQAAGLGAALGTMVKPLHFGRAASVGIEAALLAQAGFTSPATGVEGRRGFFSLMEPTSDASSLVNGLGNTWHVSEIQPKPYPCGVVAHAAIDATLGLARTVALNEDSTIEARVHPLVLDLMGKVDPQTPLEAKLSAPHLLAVAALRGTVDLSAVEPATLTDPNITRLRRAVELVEAPVQQNSAEITITSQGVPHTLSVEQSLGTRERPLSDQDVRNKAVAVCSPSLGDSRARGLIEACFGPLQLDIATLMSMTAPPSTISQKDSAHPKERS